MWNKLKQLIKGIPLALAMTFTRHKNVSVDAKVAPFSGEKEPIQELDEWGRLLNDMQSPDHETRAAAQAAWEHKPSRDAAFFAGMDLSNITPPEERGKPLELRAGWGADESHLPHDDWRDDHDWRAEVEQGEPFKRLASAEPKILPPDHPDYYNYFTNTKEIDADELDYTFYGTRPKNITKQELEESQQRDARDLSKEELEERIRAYRESDGSNVGEG